MNNSKNQKRYEHDIPNQKPFSFGITLESFEAETTNQNWIPAFLEHNVDLVHKLVQLKNFSVYCNTGENHQSIKFENTTELCDKLKEMVKFCFSIILFFTIPFFSILKDLFF
jgi:hypothetical protein